MGDLAIHLFGALRILHRGRELRPLAEGKARELLCYLLIHRQRTHEREALASVHWGECTTTQSRKNLRNALWQIRSALSEALCQRILVIGPDSVHVRQSTVSIDLAEFEQAHVSAYGMQGRELDYKKAAVLEAAVELYRDDLLEGCYQDWCLYERQRLQDIYLALLDKLMDYCEVAGQFEKGWSYGMRVLRYDAASERTYERLMRLYYHAGDRASALRQYRRCVDALRKELGVAPAKRTVNLYRRILADDLELEQPAPAALKNTPTTATFLDLKTIRHNLVELEKRLQHEISMLDSAIGLDRTQVS